MTDHTSRLLIGYLVTAVAALLVAFAMALWSISPWVIVGMCAFAILVYAVGWVIDR